MVIGAVKRHELVGGSPKRGTADRRRVPGRPARADAEAFWAELPLVGAQGRVHRLHLFRRARLLLGVRVRSQLARRDVRLDGRGNGRARVGGQRALVGKIGKVGGDGRKPLLREHRVEALDECLGSTRLAVDGALDELFLQEDAVVLEKLAQEAPVDQPPVQCLALVKRLNAQRSREILAENHRNKVSARKISAGAVRGRRDPL